MGHTVPVCLFYQKIQYFPLPQMNFLGKNLAMVYFSANFAIKIITKWRLK